MITRPSLLALYLASAITTGAYDAAAGTSRLSASTDSSNPKQKICNDYRKMTNGSLPPTLRKPDNMAALKNTDVSSRAFSDISVSALKKVVKDNALSIKRGSCEAKMINDYGKDIYCDDEKEVRLLITPEKGVLRYIHPGRRFDVGNIVDEAPAITGDTISAITTEALRAIGIPADEIISKTVIRTMTYSGNTPDATEPTAPSPAEHHVNVGRVLAGLPVFDSEATIVIDLKGAIARMALRWPNITIAPRLEDAAPRDADAIAEELAAMLSAADSSCSGYGEMRMFIAYAEIEEDSPFYYSASQENKDTTVPVYHMPALVVYAAPRSQSEDSGIITPPGMQVTVPLFELVDAAPVEKN